MKKEELTADQQACVECLNKPLLVCAGAGSGKTFTLTRRIVQALSPGSGEDGKPYLNSIDDALIITFTNKAASEIKGRVRTALRLQGTPQMLEESLRVDGAWISTIHGMCTRILRTHALELGLDPEFKVADDVQSEEMLTRALSKAMEDSNGEQAQQLAMLLQHYPTDSNNNGMSVGKAVRELLKMASRCSEGLDALETGPDAPDLAGIPRMLLTSMEAAWEALDADDSEGSTYDKARSYIPKNIETLRAYIECNDSHEKGSLADLVDALTQPSKIGNKDHPDTKRCMAEARAAYDDAAPLCKLAQSKQDLDWLIDLAHRVNAIYLQEKGDNGLVTNSDLIVLTLAALRDHPSIAQRYENAFKLVMVDEFQDTSQLQIDLIERLAGPDNLHLCTVGDSQQSIYRFQGADVNVYLRHKADMHKIKAEEHQLKMNYRSNADILAFVRKICGQPGFFAEDFLDLQAGKDGGEYLSDSPRVDVMLTTHPSGSGATDIMRKSEARAIAKRFAQLRDAGHSASDMVILMAKTTGINTYAQALRDVGLDCVVTGGSKYYEADEVKLCLSLLSSLANPADTESLFAVLSGEIWCLSSDDFLTLATRIDNEKGSIGRQRIDVGLLNLDESTASPRLAHALALFKRAWNKRGTKLPSQLIQQVVVESGWLARLQDGGVSGQAKAGNVIKFMRLLKQVEEDGAKGLASASVAMQQLAQGEKERPGTLMAKNDAVRIMTIHASKGLEFGFVAVVNVFEQPQNKSGLVDQMDGSRCNVTLIPSKLKVPTSEEHELHPNSNPSDWAGSIREQSIHQERMERQRLLYVALTRASRALIVTHHKALAKDGSVAIKGLSEYLFGALFPDGPDQMMTSGTVEYGGSQPATYTFIDAQQLSEADGDNDATEENTVHEMLNTPIPVLKKPPFNDTRPAASIRPDFFSYSSIAHHEPYVPSSNGERNDASYNQKQVQKAMAADPTPQIQKAMAADPTPQSDADKATDFGSAVHRVAEWMALMPSCPPAQQIEEACERMASIYDVRDGNRLQSAVQRWSSSVLCATAFGFATHNPEVPFFCPIEGEVMEGEIDLLCSNDDSHAFIIDYKTGGSPDENAEQLHEKHLLQAQCYAYAVMQQGCTSVELHFVRVEQKSDDDASQPQVVDYSFTSKDMPYLLKTISAARQQAKQ